jgi:ferritin-like metal-binding protein YciE
MAKKTELRDLLLEELRDLYHAEKQLVRAFPKLAKGAASDDVQAAMRDGIENTKQHVERLETVFEKLEARTRGKPCHAMEGLIQEAEEILEEDLSDELKDAALVAAVQKMGHYTIASYGTLASYARAIGEEEIAGLLGESLAEHKQADEDMTELAENEVNPRAMSVGEESSEDEQAVAEATTTRAAAGNKPSSKRKTNKG